MFAISALLSLAACALFVALGTPIVQYFQDPKGLRKYPLQNVFSGLTGLAYGWEVGRSHRIFHTRRLHEQLMKHPVVRVGPNWLSFGRVQATRDIYGYNSPCMKGGIYDKLQGGGEHLVNITSRSLHSSRRKMVAVSYAPRNIEMWEPKVNETMRVLLSKMDTMCTEAPVSPSASISDDELKFDANLYGMLFAFDCVIKIGLSKDVGFVARGTDLAEVTRSDGKTKEVHVIDCLHSGSRAASTLIWDVENFPMWRNIAMKVSRWYAAQFDNASYWRGFIEQLSEERFQRSKAGEELDDLSQLMIEDRKGIDADITKTDRVAETDQMVNGGGDGPGISLVNTLYYLVKHPETLDRLRAELDKALAGKTEHPVAWQDVKNLPYLRACVDESMRLSPPVATDLVRITPPDRSYTVDGHVVPPRTNISISAYTSHRDPDVFDDPDAFRPERWLKVGKEQLNAMLSAYIPFSAGSRGCIGRNVTILMQLVYVATLVHRYDFALPSADWEMTWTDYFNLWPNELRLKVWRRQPAASAV